MGTNQKNTALVADKETLPATAPQRHTESAAVLSIIERVAMNPDADIDKMERLLQMHERMKAQQAQQEFAEALSEMQIELPIIEEHGTIRNKQGQPQSTYALWEDINEAIKPVLSKHGFALTFRTDCSAGIRVVGVLSHRAGHREETEMLLPPDTTGSKNTVQAIASSISYGKRYTAGALLNITSRGEDDDGNGGRFEGGAREQQADPVSYPEEKFNQNFPAWAEKIRAGTNNAARLIDLIESKGMPLTAAQKKRLHNVKTEVAQ